MRPITNGCRGTARKQIAITVGTTVKNNPSVLITAPAAKKVQVWCFGGHTEQYSAPGGHGQRATLRGRETYHVTYEERCFVDINVEL